MRRTDWRLSLAFFIILAFLMGNAFVANRSITGLVETQKLVTHSWRVRTNLQDLVAEFETSIAAARGFYIMGDPAFLEAFHTAQRKIGDDIDQVEQLTRDNPTQNRHAMELRSLLLDQMSIARINVERKRVERAKFVVTPALMEKSKQRIRRIQAKVEEIDRIEQNLAAQRSLRAEYDERQTRLTIFGATAAAALALVAAIGLIRQILNERQLSEARVRQINADLEQRVLERTESLQATNDKLNVANRELESFSYTVSHDLRAPLRHVAGFADLLEKKSGALLDESGRRYVNLIKEAGRRAGQLIDDLLAFSRMSRTELTRTEIPMQEKVEKIKSELNLENPDRPLVWDIAQLPTVYGDKAMLRLVWRNLLENAVKYSSKEDTSRIQVGYRETDSHHEFFVKDNGVGFDMAHSENLFGVFQRLHHAEEFEGTGIGLATVHRIILRHGGQTWAESVPGEGATFYFTLPVAQRGAEEQGIWAEEQG